LFGEKIDTSLLKAGGFDGTSATSGTNGACKIDGSLESLTAGVSLDRDEARIGLLGDITITDTSTNHSRGNHDNVQGFGKLQKVEGNSITGGDDQSSVGKQMVTDLILPDLLLIFIRNEKEDDFSLGNGFANGDSTETISNSTGLVFIIDVANNNVLETRITKVKSLSTSYKPVELVSCMTICLNK
jgi:hypothetical protein